MNQIKNNNIVKALSFIIFTFIIVSFIIINAKIAIPENVSINSPTQINKSIPLNETNHLNVTNVSNENNQKTNLLNYKNDSSREENESNNELGIIENKEIFQNEEIILTEEFKKLNIKFFQLEARLNSPIKWSAMLENIPTTNISFALPLDAFDVRLNSNDILKLEKNKVENRILATIYSSEINENKKIYFSTPPPIKIESEKIQNIGNNDNEKIYIKNISFFNNASLNYSNISVFSEIPETSSSRIKIYNIIPNINVDNADITESNEYQILFKDTNNNGLIDRLEWVIPVLDSSKISEFEIHLDYSKPNIRIIREQSNGVGTLKDMRISFLIINEGNVTASNILIEDTLPPDWVGYPSLRIPELKPMEMTQVEYDVISPELEGNYIFQAKASYDGIFLLNLTNFNVEVNDSKAFFEITQEFETENTTRILDNNTIYPLTISIKNIGNKSVTDYETFFTLEMNSSLFFTKEKYLECANREFIKDTDEIFIKCVWPKFYSLEEKKVLLNLKTQKIGDSFFKINITYDPPGDDSNQNSLNLLNSLKNFIAKIINGIKELFLSIAKGNPTGLVIKEPEKKSNDITNEITSDVTDQQKEQSKTANNDNQDESTNLLPEQKIEKKNIEDSKNNAENKDIKNIIIDKNNNNEKTNNDKEKNENTNNNNIDRISDLNLPPNKGYKGGSSSPKTPNPAQENNNDKNKDDNLNQDNIIDKNKKDNLSNKIWITTIQEKFIRVKASAISAIKDEEKIPFFNLITDSNNKTIDLIKKIKKKPNEEYEVEIQPKNKKIKKIKIEDLKIKEDEDFNLRFDDVSADRVSINNLRIENVFAIDPTKLNFTNATITITAKGSELFKCKEWDFNNQICNGNWIKIMNIIPGADYEIILTPEDPGYAETGVATINTNKSIYFPYETAKIIMVVLDKNGYLVSGANVKLRVATPDSSSYTYTTTNSTAASKITEVRKGIYQAEYNYTSLEGNYSMTVEAYGNDVNSTMSSFFIVKSYYEFDIIRFSPPTIDPWAGSYKTTINIISYTNSTFFNFTESLPINFTITESRGAIETTSSFKKYLKWTNLTNNSEISYYALAPLISPDLYELGPAFIDYDSGTFHEARPWFLAIDPTGPTGTSNPFVTFGNLTTTKNVSYNELTGSWGLAESGPNTGTPQWIISKPNRRRNEIITGVMNTSGYLFAAIWNGSEWKGLLEINNSVNNSLLRGFDVATESKSGQAVIFYSLGKDGKIYYRSWNGRVWSGEGNFVTANTIIEWIRAEPSPNPNSNEITLAYSTNNTNVPSYVYGLIWDGTALGNNAELTRIGSKYSIGTQFFDVAYEQLTYHSMIVTGIRNTSTLIYRKWNGVAWENANNLTVPNFAGTIRWVRLASKPDSNKIMFGGVCGSNDLNTGDWNETRWILQNHTIHIGTVETILSRPFDIAWVNFSGTQQGMISYGDATDPMVYKLWNDNNHSWTTGTSIDFAGSWTDHRIISLKWDEIKKKVWFLEADDASDINLASYDSNAWNWDAELAGMHSCAAYKECFYIVPATNWVKIDNPPNITSLNAPVNYTLTNANLIEFNFTPVDDWDFLNCTLFTNFSGAWLPNASNFTINNGSINNISASPPEGYFIWNIRCFDDYEQEGWHQANYTLRVDRTQPGFPDIAIAPNPAQHNISNVSVNWTAYDVHINSTYANVTYPNGTFFAKFYSNFTLETSNLSEPGTYTITFFANDSLGYVNFTSISLIINDSTAPQISLTYPQNNGYIRDEPVNFTFRVGDASNITNCLLTFNSLPGGTLYNVTKGLSQNISWAGLPDDTYTWFVNCTDTYNNSGGSEIESFILDRKAPIISLNQPSNDSWDNDSYVQVSYTPVILSGSPFSSCELWGNWTASGWGKNQTNSTQILDNQLNYFQWLNLSDGDYLWNVRCNDSAGNFNFSIANFTIHADSITPSINFTNPTAPNNTNQTSRTIIINATHTERNPHTIIINFNGTLYYRSYSGTYTNITLENLLDGEYTYTINLNDSAGHNNKTEIRTIRIDNKPPLINLSGPRNNTWTNIDNVFFYYNTTDEQLSIMNCSLIINGKINITNQSINQGIISSINKTLNNGNYEWNINCTDSVLNQNSSETRLIKVDTTLPEIYSERINATDFQVNDYICLNVSVNDSYSGLLAVYAEINYPTSGHLNVTLTNTTGGCGNSGGSVYSLELKNIESGIYNWTKTYAIDNALNVKAATPSSQLYWSTITSNEISVSLTAPNANIKINESAINRYNYSQVCNVSCTIGTCNNVLVFPQYYNEGWNDITLTNNNLISSNNNISCGNLIFPNNCSATFTIISGNNSGGNIWPIRCTASSSNAATTYSDTINLTINDYPAAQFTYPSNGRWLRGIEIINFSVSTDDFNISRYTLEIANNTDFTNNLILCNSDNNSCRFNTTNQTKCLDESLNCYLRLNVTDTDDLKNSSYIQIGIDNTGPRSILDFAKNGTNISLTSYTLNATITDNGIGVNITNFLYRQDSASAWNNACTDADGKAPFECSWSLAGLSDGNSYEIRVFANDSLGNIGTNDTHYNITIDRRPPIITQLAPANNSWKKENVTFIYSVSDISFIQNCSIIMNGIINYTNFSISKISNNNFTISQIPENNYTWEINCTDQLGNTNTSGLWIIGIDLTGPIPKLDMPYNFSNYSSGNYEINASFLDAGIGVNASIFEYRQNTTQTWTQICTDDVPPSYSCTWNTASLAEGKTYEIRMRANDSLGNFGSYDNSYNITIDKKPPIITLISPENLTQNVNGSIYYTYNVTDEFSEIFNCSLIINGTINETKNDIIKDSNLFFQQNFSSYTWLWNINCTDVAGNTNTSSIYQFNVSPDIEAPIVTLIFPEDKSIDSDGDILFMFNVSDALSEISNCSLLINGIFNKTNESAVLEGETNIIHGYNYTNGQHNWSINCTDDSSGHNIGSSSIWNLTVRISTTITTDVIMDKKRYQIGELANVITNTSDEYFTPINATVKTDIIFTNTTIYWWNSSWLRRKMIYINETYGRDRTNIRISLNVTNLNGFIKSCADEIRVVKHNASEASAFNLVSSDNSTYCDIIFVANVSANLFNSNLYYVYYNNSNAIDQNYPGLVKNTQIMYEDFEQAGEGWVTVINSICGATNLCPQNSPWGDFNFCHNYGADSADICRDSIASGSAYEGTYSLLMHDAVPFPIPYGGIGQNIFPWTDCENGECSDIVVRFAAAASGLDSGVEQCLGWVVGYNTTYKKFYNCSGTDACNLLTPPTQSSQWNIITMNMSFYNISMNQSEINISVSEDASAASDYCWFDAFNITGVMGIAANITAWTGSDELLISTTSNNTGLEGLSSFDFDTFNQSYGNYTAITLATKAGYLNSVAYEWFEIIQDVISPVITLISPLNDTWTNNPNQTFLYLVVDNSHHYSNCSILFNYIFNTTNTTQILDNQTNNFSVTNIPDGYYNWTVNCTDYSGNVNSSINWIINIDATKPTIIFGSLTETNNTYVNRNWSYVDIIADDQNEANVTFYLYNSSRELINQTNINAGSRSINFTNLNSNTYYYYNVTIYDKSGNSNSTETRIINFDSILPQVEFAGATEPNGAFKSRNWIYVNVSVYDTYENNITFYLYNSTALVLNLTYTTQIRSYNFTNLNPNEIYFYNVTVIDIAGNENTTPSRNITLDSMNPQVSLDNPPNNEWFNYINITIIYTATDSNLQTCTLYHNSSGIFRRNTTNSSVISGSSGNFILNFSNGNVVWNVLCNDSAGNYAFGSSNKSFNVDTIAPNADYAGGTEQNGVYRSRNWIYINISSTDNNISFYLYNSTGLVNNSGFITSKNINFTGLNSNEIYYYNATIRDRAGNYNYTVTRNITLDTIIPTVGLNSPQNNDWDGDGIITFNFIAQDIHIQSCTLYHNASGTFRSNVTNNSVNNWTNTDFTIQMQDGTFLWNVLCNDSANNRAFNETNNTINIDSNAPGINFAGGTNNNGTFKNRNWIYVNVTIVEANFNNITFYLFNSTELVANITYSSLTKSYNFTNLNPNQYYYYNVTVMDKVGKINSTPTRNITLDSISPSISIVANTPVNNTNLSLGNFVVNITHSDLNPNTLRLFFNNTINQTKTWIGTYSNFTFNNVFEGRYIFYAWINDSASNSNQTEIRQITIDRTPPNIYLENPLNDSWRNSGNTLTTFRYNTSDNLLEVSNCSLIINNNLNVTNYTIIRSVSQNFSIQLDGGYYNWSVNCTDYVGNTNFSTTRALKVDTVFPVISEPSINYTNISIFSTVCINVTVTDSFSGVDKVYARFKYPTGNIYEYQMLDNTTTICDNVNFDGIYSLEVKSNQIGTYNWSRIMANDSAGNVYYEYPLIEWNVTSIGRLAVNLSSPLVNFEVNESDSSRTYEFNQTCFVRCEDTLQNCSDVSIMPEFNLSVSSEINTNSLHLVGSEDSYNCGNLTSNGTGCNHTFTIATSEEAGKWFFRLKCKANSSDVGNYLSGESVNVYVNDHPNASIKYPLNGSYIGKTYTLNFSETNDDGNITNYRIEMDNNLNFDSPSLLYQGQNNFYVFDTTFQVQCDELSFNCYLRLNVTDNDDLKNSTYTYFAIDNIGPVTTIGFPFQFANISANYSLINATSVDSGIGTQSVRFEFRENSSEGWIEICTTSSGPTFSCNWNLTNLSDGKNYELRTRSNDTIGNWGDYNTIYNITVDRTGPISILTKPQNSTNITVTYYNVNATINDFASHVDTVVFEYRLNVTDNWHSICIDQDRDPLFNCTWDLSNLGNSENSYEVRVRTNDTLGNLGLYDTHYNISLRRIPPSIELISPLNNIYESSTATFIFNVSDSYNNISNCSLVFDNVKNTTNLSVNKEVLQSFTINEISQGSYSWRINCTNEIGLENTSIARTIVVDLSGPITRIDSPFNFSNISSSIFIINASANDLGVGVNSTTFEYRINEADNWKFICTNFTGPSYSCAWNTSGLSEGNNYEVRARSNDSLGNIGSYDNRTNITIDRQSPVINLEYPLNNSQDINGAISFSFNAYDVLLGVSNCSLLINGSVVSTNTTIVENISKNISINLNNGTYLWSVNCSDSAGNIGGSEFRNITVAPDTSPPIITLISPFNQTTETKRTIVFTYNVTDLLSEIANCSLIFNNKVNLTNTTLVIEDSENSFSLSRVPDGNYSWSVNCSDIFGNKGESLTYNFTVIEASQLIVNFTIEKNIIEKGELILTQTNVTDRVGNFISSNITISVMKNNVSLPWWNSSFKYRQMLNITNLFYDVLEENFTVNFTINTQALISSGKLNISGYDLRIAYFDNETNEWTELDRIAEDLNTQNTKILFKTKKPIEPNYYDYGYHMYYGNDSLTSAPDDKNNVYLFFDGFDSNSLSNYPLTHPFEDYVNEDDNNTVSYDASGKMLKYLGTNTKGKSITRNIPFANNYVLEADQIINDYFTAGKFQLAARINDSSYYFVSISTSVIFSSEVGVYVNGVKQYSITSAVKYTTEPTKHHSKMIIYDNGDTINITAYVDSDLIFTYNDSNKARIFNGSGIGSGYFRVPDGYWDNISVRKYLPKEPSVLNGNEEELVIYYRASTEPQGKLTYYLNTTNLNYFNYTIISFATSPPYYLNGYDLDMIEVLPDRTPPYFINYSIPTFIFNNQNLTISIYAEDRSYNLQTVFIEGNWTGTRINYSMQGIGGGLFIYSINSSDLHSKQFVTYKFYANDTEGNLNQTELNNFSVVKSVANVSVNYPVFEISTYLNESFWLNSTLNSLNGTIYECNLTVTYNNTGLNLIGSTIQVIGNLSNGTSSSAGKWYFNSTLAGRYNLNISSGCMEGDSTQLFSARVEVLEPFVNLTDTFYAERKIMDGNTFYHLTTDTGLNIWMNNSGESINQNKSDNKKPWFFSNWLVIINDSLILGFENITWDIKKIGINEEYNFTYINFIGRSRYPELKLNLTKNVYENSIYDNITLNIENIGASNINNIKLKWVVDKFDIDTDSDWDNLTFINSSNEIENHPMNSITNLNYQSNNFNTSRDAILYFIDSSTKNKGYLYWNWNMSNDTKSGYNNFSLKAGGNNFSINITFDFGSLTQGQIKGFDPGAGIWTPNLIQRTLDITSIQATESGTTYTDVTSPLTDNNFGTTSFAVARSGNNVRILNILNLSGIAAFDNVYLRVYPTAIDTNPYPVIFFAYNSDNITVQSDISSNFTFTNSHLNTWVQINITAISHTQDSFNYLRIRLAPNSSFLPNSQRITFAEIGFNVTDETKPSVNLNWPVNNYNTTQSKINFSWITIDKIDINMTCNLTLDGKVNISNIDSLNGSQTNFSIDGIPEGVHYWNITCWDDSMNVNFSSTYYFTVIDYPDSLIASLDFDNSSVVLNWSNVSYADSYMIFISDINYSEFSTIPNITGIMDLNWTDFFANQSTQRYYKIATVKGTINKTSMTIVGKYLLKMDSNWTLMSSPLDITNKIMGDENIYRNPLYVKPYGAIKSIFRYNDTRGIKWERVNYVEGFGWDQAIGSEEFTMLENWRGYWLESNQSGNVTLVGTVPSGNITVGTFVNWTIVSWLSLNSPILPTYGEPPYYPFQVNPADSIVSVFFYNETTNEYSQKWRATDHYSGWGWWPYDNSPEFIGLEPGKGYYLKVDKEASWIMEARS